MFFTHQLKQLPPALDSDLQRLTAAHTDNSLLPCPCSISTVYKALCIATRQAVIIKSYEKAKMKQKNFLRMEREIKLMNMLGEALAAWQQLPVEAAMAAERPAESEVLQKTFYTCQAAAAT